MSMVILMLACSLGLFAAVILTVVGQIMLAVAIYRDAQSLGMGGAVLFLVFTILFGSITAIIYLIVRSSYDTVPENADLLSSSRMAKISIILTVIGVLLMLVLLLVFFNTIMAGIPMLITA